MANNTPVTNTLHLTFKGANENASLDETKNEAVDVEVSGCLSDDQKQIKEDCIVLYYVDMNGLERIINYKPIAELYGYNNSKETSKNRTINDFKEANLMVNFMDVIKDGNGTIKPNTLARLAQGPRPINEGMYMIDSFEKMLSFSEIKELRDKWEKDLMRNAYDLGRLNHFSLDKVEGTSFHLTSKGPSADYIALDAGKPIGTIDGNMSSPRAPLLSTWARWADPASAGNAMKSIPAPNGYINSTMGSIFGNSAEFLSVTIDEKYYHVMGHGNTYKTHGQPATMEEGTNDELWNNTSYYWNMDLNPGYKKSNNRTVLSYPPPPGISMPELPPGITPLEIRKKIADEPKNSEFWKDILTKSEKNYFNVSIETFYGGNQEKANAWDAADISQKQKLIIVKLHGDGGQRDEVLVMDLLMKNNNHYIAACTNDNVHMCCLYGINVGCIYTGGAKTMFPDVFKKQKYRERVVQFVPEKDPVLSFFKEREYALLQMCEHNYNVSIQLKQIIKKLESSKKLHVFLGKCEQQQKYFGESSHIGGALKFFTGLLYDCNIYIVNILYELFGKDLFGTKGSDEEPEIDYWIISTWNKRRITFPNLKTLDLSDFMQEFSYTNIGLKYEDYPEHFTWEDPKYLPSEGDYRIYDAHKKLNYKNEQQDGGSDTMMDDTMMGELGHILELEEEKETNRDKLDIARKKLIEVKRLNYVMEVFFWDSSISTVIINGGAKFTPGTKTSFKPGMAYLMTPNDRTGTLKGSYQHIFQMYAGEMKKSKWWDGTWPVMQTVQPSESSESSRRKRQRASSSSSSLYSGGGTPTDVLTKVFPPYKTPWGNNLDGFKADLTGDLDVNNVLKFMYNKEFSVATDDGMEWQPLIINLNNTSGQEVEKDLNKEVLERLKILVTNLFNHPTIKTIEPWGCYTYDVCLKTLVDLYLAECYTSEIQVRPGIEGIEGIEGVEDIKGIEGIEGIDEANNVLLEAKNVWFDNFIYKLLLDNCCEVSADTFSDDLSDMLSNAINTFIENQEALREAKFWFKNSIEGELAKKDIEALDGYISQHEKLKDDMIKKKDNLKLQTDELIDILGKSILPAPEENLLGKRDSSVEAQEEVTPAKSLTPGEEEKDESSSSGDTADVARTPQEELNEGTLPSTPSRNENKLTSEKISTEEKMKEKKKRHRTFSQSHKEEGKAKQIKLGIKPGTGQIGNNKRDYSQFKEILPTANRANRARRKIKGGSKKKKTRRRKKKKKTKKRLSKNNTKTRSNRRKKRSKEKKRRNNNRS